MFGITFSEQTGQKRQKRRMDKPIHVWEIGLPLREHRLRQYYPPPADKPQDYTQPSLPFPSQPLHNAETLAPV